MEERNWFLSSFGLKEDARNDKSSYVHIYSQDKKNNEWNITPKDGGYVISLAKDDCGNN